MKTNSAFQVLLGLGCVGAAIAANVFWPFAHDSYLVAIFAGITYIFCGWLSYKVSADKSRLPAEVSVAQSLMLVSVTVDFFLLAQITNNLTAFFTDFLQIRVDWYEGHPLLQRGHGLVVCAVDASLTGLCIVHLLTATTSARALGSLMYAYARDDELIAAYGRHGSAIARLPRVWTDPATRARFDSTDVNAIFASQYYPRPHPLYPQVQRHPSEGLPRISYSPPPKE